MSGKKNPRGNLHPWGSRASPGVATVPGRITPGSLSSLQKLGQKLSRPDRYTRRLVLSWLFILSIKILIVHSKLLVVDLGDKQSMSLNFSGPIETPMRWACGLGCCALDLGSLWRIELEPTLLRLDKTSQFVQFGSSVDDTGNPLFEGFSLWECARHMEPLNTFGMPRVEAKRH